MAYFIFLFGINKIRWRSRKGRSIYFSEQGGRIFQEEGSFEVHIQGGERMGISW